MRNLKDYGETPDIRLDELPVIKSFLRGSDPAKSTQFTEDFYRMMAEANSCRRCITNSRALSTLGNCPLYGVIGSLALS